MELKKQKLPVDYKKNHYLPTKKDIVNRDKIHQLIQNNLIILLLEYSTKYKWIITNYNTKDKLVKLITTHNTWSVIFEGIDNNLDALVYIIPENNVIYPSEYKQIKKLLRDILKYTGINIRIYNIDDLKK